MPRILEGALVRSRCLLGRPPLAVRAARLGLFVLLLPIAAAEAQVVAGCDFHGDGYADLVHRAGVTLFIHAGTAAGIVPSTWQAMRFDEQYVQPGGYPGGGDTFGKSAACGDFNNDGFDDLATQFDWNRNLDPYYERNNTIAVFHGYGGELSVMAAGYIHSVLQGPGLFGVEPDSRLAAGDFNDDGFDDLLDSYYTQTVQGFEEAGELWVSSGGSSGIGAMSTFHQGSPGVSESPGNKEHLGKKLAVGDFNEDGFDDAVAWFEEFSFKGLHVVFGGSGGLPNSDQILHAPPGQRITDFATGDFDGNGCDDLAVAVTMFPEGASEAARRVRIFGGCSGGPGVLTAAPTIEIDYDQDLDIPSDGYPIVAVGDFDGDGFEDLAMGCAFTGCSRIAVLPGGVGGLDPSVIPPQVWSAESPGLEAFASIEESPHAEVSDDGAGFGASLATGDFNGDGLADLAIGDLWRCAILMLYGEGSRGLTAAGSTYLKSPGQSCFGWLHQPQR